MEVAARKVPDAKLKEFAASRSLLSLRFSPLLACRHSYGYCETLRSSEQLLSLRRDFYSRILCFRERHSMLFLGQGYQFLGCPISTALFIPFSSPLA